MTLEKAIKILETKQPESASISDEDEAAAANLAIEAMKFLQKKRRSVPYYFHGPLPGETKE